MNHLDIARHGADQLQPIVSQLRDLYAAVYAEPPYYEGLDQVNAFESRLADQACQPGMVLFAATCSAELIGYLYGFNLKFGSPLWSEVFLLPDNGPGCAAALVPRSSVAYISELLVARGWRRRGIGRALHDRFIMSRYEDYVALLAHPKAEVAQSAYRTWGYRRCGRGRPFPGVSLYDTLLKQIA
jgi:GNAT superfamily N-acetyltransferase